MTVNEKPTYQLVFVRQLDGTIIPMTEELGVRDENEARKQYDRRTLEMKVDRDSREFCYQERSHCDFAVGLCHIDQAGQVTVLIGSTVAQC
jgi:hypothetical protein